MPTRCGLHCSWLRQVFSTQVVTLLCSGVLQRAQQPLLAFAEVACNVAGPLHAHPSTAVLRLPASCMHTCEAPPPDAGMHASAAHPPKTDRLPWPSMRPPPSSPQIWQLWNRMKYQSSNFAG